jgi:hypothetical protein
MHTICTRLAGSSRRAWESRRPWHVRALPWQSCDLIEITAPNGFRLQLGCSRCSGCILHACRPEGAGTSVGDRGSTVESHVARLFKFVPPMCSVRSRLGNGHALRLVRLAARQLTAVSTTGPGCIGSIMRAPSHAIDHHRNRPLEPNPSSGPRAPMLLRDAGGCDDGSALRCTCSHDLTGRFRSKGQKCPAHPKRGQIDRAHHALPESATLRSLSERLTLITAVTSILLRHGRLRRERDEPLVL